MSEITGRLFEFGAAVMLGHAGPDGRGRLASGMVLGTAFRLSANYWMTAAHVARNFVECTEPNPQLILVLYGPDGHFRPAFMERMELLSADTALLEVSYSVDGAEEWTPALPWDLGNAPAFYEVRAIGYPYGSSLVDDQLAISARGFQGYVVGHNSRFQAEEDGERFAAFELSFAAPKGLSGAALVTASSPPRVIGLVIGNSEQSMMVFSNRELVEEKNETTIVERYEMLTLGIAVKASQLVQLQSTLLGTTIGEHLESVGSLPRKAET